MKKILGIGLALVALLTGCVLSDGAQTAQVLFLNMVETTEFTPDGELLFMNGEINTKTRNQFDAVIADNPGITTLVACEVPGSLDDDTMIPLSYRVRELGLATYLTADSMVASGGTDLFLAGTARLMEAGAEIGVHSWSDGTNDAADFPKTAPEHEANRKYIADMLGSDAFYWFTIYAAPAADIYWMTEADIAEYGLLTAPVVRPDQSDIECPQ